MQRTLTNCSLIKKVGATPRQDDGPLEVLPDIMEEE